MYQKEVAAIPATAIGMRNANKINTSFAFDFPAACQVPGGPACFLRLDHGVQEGHARHSAADGQAGNVPTSPGIPTTGQS